MMRNTNQKYYSNSTIIETITNTARQWCVRNVAYEGFTSDSFHDLLWGLQSRDALRLIGEEEVSGAGILDLEHGFRSRLGTEHLGRIYMKRAHAGAHLNTVVCHAARLCRAAVHPSSRRDTKTKP